jgi:O-antigen/teichoic acid export membrane protein
LTSKLVATFISKLNWIAQGKSATSATLQNLIARVFILGINMATGIITARALGPQGRGEQAAIAMWSTVIAYTLTFGIPASLIHHLKRSKSSEEQGEWFASAVVMGTFLGGIATVVGYIVIPVWMAKYSAEAIQEAQWMMWAAPLNLLMLFFNCTLESLGDFSRSNRNRYFAPLITLVMLSLLVKLELLTPFSAVLAFAFPTIPIFLENFIYLQKKFRPDWSSAFSKRAGKLTAYGLRAYGIDVLNTLSGQVDQLFIVGLLSNEALGMYAVAISVSRMLYLIQSSVVVVLLPKMTGLPLEDVVNHVGRAARLSIIFSVIGGIFIVGVGSNLLVLFYGTKFVGSLIALKILTLEAAFSNIAAVIGQTFLAVGKPMVATILQGIGLGVTIPLMSLLIPGYGLEGACWGLVISTTIRLCFMLVCFKGVLGIKPPNLIPNTSDFQFMKSKISHSSAS